MNSKSRQISRKEAYTWIGVCLVVVTVVGYRMTHQTPADPQFERAKADHQKIECAALSLDAAMAYKAGDQTALDAANGKLGAAGCLK